VKKNATELHRRTRSLASWLSGPASPETASMLRASSPLGETYLNPVHGRRKAPASGTEPSPAKTLPDRLMADRPEPPQDATATEGTRPCTCSHLEGTSYDNNR
jgi:hypothetical protein